MGTTIFVRYDKYFAFCWFTVTNVYYKQSFRTANVNVWSVAGLNVAQ